MDEEAYRVEARVERDHWWFRVRRRIVASLVERLEPALPAGARVLDLGCGTGANGPALAAPGRLLVGADRSTVALRLLGEGGAPHGARICADATALPFASGSFDLVACLDVLEHLGDDRAGARELARLARPGGAVLVTVPAHELLWGRQDELGHHFRRYSRPALLSTVEAANLRVERITAFNSILLLPIVVGRAVLRLAGRWAPENENDVGGPLARKVLEAIFGLEVPLVSRCDLPVGVSLAVVARRGDAHGAGGASRSRR